MNEDKHKRKKEKRKEKRKEKMKEKRGRKRRREDLFGHLSRGAVLFTLLGWRKSEFREKRDID